MSEPLKSVTLAVAAARESSGTDEDIATAAIKALRSPTPEMLYAMAMSEDRDGIRSQAAAFNAAIDAALNSAG